LSEIVGDGYELMKFDKALPSLLIPLPPPYLSSRHAFLFH
jgi:hypothetical protein